MTPTLFQVREGAQSQSIASGVIALVSDRQVIQVELDENVTSITLDRGGAPTGTAVTIALFLYQDATGSRTVAGWDADIDWGDTGAPTQTSTASKGDLYVFMNIGGTKWLGQQVETGIAAAFAA